MNASQALLTIGGHEDPLLPKLIRAINLSQEIDVAVSFVRTYSVLAHEERSDQITESAKRGFLGRNSGASPKTSSIKPFVWCERSGRSC